MKYENKTSSLFITLQLLQAYEHAIEENIICSITDMQGVIVHANRMFCEISKYSTSELIGSNHRIINSGYHSKEFFKNMWQTIGRGNVWHNEIKNKAKDGTYYWVDTVIVPIMDEKGKQTHHLALRTLITEKKQLEEKKAQYVSSLEVLLVMTSNRVKNPLSNCLKQINNFNAEKILKQRRDKTNSGQLKIKCFRIEYFYKRTGNIYPRYGKLTQNSIF